MGMHRKYEYGWLFRVSLRFLKGYFLFGLIIACLLTTILGFFPLVQAIMTFTGEWIVRILGLAIALTATGVIVESLRS